MGIKFYSIVGLIVAALALGWYFRHDIIKAEDNKQTVVTDTNLLNIEDKKNEIRNVPVSDARTANRLLNGTYFNH